MAHPKFGTSLLIGLPLILLLALLAVQYRKTVGIEQRLAKLESSQRQLQETYLDGSRERKAQLAASLGYRRVPRAPPPGPAFAVAGDASAVSGAPPTPAQAEQSLRQQRERLEREFASESTNATWAGTTNQNVQDLLRQAALQGHDVRNAQVDCRSSTCRIKFDVGTSDNLDMLTESLLTDMAPDLPIVKSLQQATPDGTGIELTLYASRR